MKVNKEDLAGKLIAVENELNEVYFKDCSIGGLLSKYHENIYHGREVQMGLFSLINHLFRFTLKGLSTSKYKIKSNIKPIVFLSKIADKIHCNSLIDPIKNEFKDTTLLYEPGKKGDLNPYFFTKKYSIELLIEVVKFFIYNFRVIKRSYKSNNIKISKNHLFFNLFVQIISLNAWLIFFSKNKPKIVVVDSDRDNRNSPIISAAKKMSIITITLVHGVMSHPYGYWPIIADEIWCWSNFQKEQLILHNIEESQIKIVGNPIAKKFIVKNFQNRLNKINIGIALNNFSDNMNKEIVDFCLSNSFSNELFFRIKLHPSMKKTKWMENINRDNVEFYDVNEIKHDAYFDLIDLLIVGNSGLGYEAVINDVPIWVYNVTHVDLNVEYGHDRIMIVQGKCPDITKKENLQLELFKLINESNYIKNLLELEQQFVLNYFYYAIGDSANQNIINEIKKLLS